MKAITLDTCNLIRRFFTLFIFLGISTLLYSQQLISFVNGGGVPVNRSPEYMIDVVVYRASGGTVTSPASFKVIAERGGNYIVLNDSTYTVQPNNQTAAYLELKIKIADTLATTSDTVVIKLTNLSGANSGSGMSHLFIIKPRPSVSVLESEPLSLFSVSPNPASQSAFIEFEAMSNEAGNISVYDITGKSVYTKEISATAGKNNIEVPVSLLQNGMYFATINIGSSKATVKLMVRN